MPGGPIPAIPDATQPFVDRLVGAQVGEYRVQARATAGRLGTLYRATHEGTGKPVTLEVLRTELVGHDEEARAANAIKVSGIATVLGFGELPDGRRYRVLEPLGGESLLQLVERRGALPPRDVARLLAKIAAVLQAAHAWAIVHGRLTPSSVFLEGDAVKVIDYGLAKAPVGPDVDLAALGAIGFGLVTGRELLDDAAPPPRGATPELLDRLLRELVEKRIRDATEARRELEALEGLLDPATAAAAPTPAPQRRFAVVLLSALAIVAAVIGVSLVPAEERAPEAAPPPASAAPVEPVQPPPLQPPPAEPPVEAPPPPPPETAEPAVPRPPPTKGLKGSRRPPSARALSEEVQRLEERLRKRAKPGSDIDQALHMLNKQRLRLTGAPTDEELLDVARQLALWRRSYLRP